jgi:tRNA (cytidine/uridine-2'-O-)-methyltransferase
MSRRPTPTATPEKHVPIEKAELRHPFFQAEVVTRLPAVEREPDGYITAACAVELAHFHPEVVLVSPDIPQNTGSIGRMCAGLAANLHLIEPMPFTITEKKVRRAGLDYWEHVRVATHPSWDAFFATRSDRRFVFVETGGTEEPATFQFEPGDLLVFGSETKGLPEALMAETARRTRAHVVTIPMFNRGVRSFNLANTVSIVLYHAVARLHLRHSEKDLKGE